MTDIITVFSTVGVIITIGFLANVLFRRTGFSDAIFLLFIGVVLGPIMQIFPRENLLPMTPLLASLALVMILFDGGLHMSLNRVLSQSLRSIILAVMYLFSVTIGVSLFAHFVMYLEWLEALMLSPMIAGTSSVVIIPLVSKLNINKECGVTLTLESAVTDILNIVLLVTILEMYSGGFVSLEDAITSIAAKFAVGVLLGMFFGVFWIRVIYTIRNMEYTYIFMIAVLLICYTVTEILGGSGALALLLFGLVLGNDRDIVRMLRMKMDASSIRNVQRILRRFHGELSFLIRTFFFVFLGLIYDVSGVSVGFIYDIIPVPLLTGIFYGLIFTGIDLILRYGAVWVSTANSPMSSHRSLMTLMCGQGLAHAVLSVIVYEKLMEMGVEIGIIYPIIVVNVIIMTNIVTSIAPLLHKTKI